MSRPAILRVRRMTATSDVLVVLRPTTHVPDLPAILVRRLARLYGEVLPGARAFARWDRSGTHVVAGLTRDPHDGPAPGLLLWGLAVGDAGEATDAELARVADGTARARDLLGTWVLLVEEEHGVRLISSADLVHTLVRADGPDGVAWSTKGAAALRCVGAPLRLALDRVPELVVLDYVLGDDELLEGTRVLDEASVVVSSPEGVVESSYWTVEERMTPGDPTGAEDLREVLGAELVRLARVPGAHVALTAGRDSTLVLSCLLEHGVVPPTFTMGHGAFPDVVGARAAAEAAGAEHRLLGLGEPLEPALERAVGKSAWTEGMDTAWNLIGSDLVWDGPEPVVWLGGNGGEIGRAFYWDGTLPGAHAPRELAAHLLGPAARMRPAARQAFGGRLQSALADARQSQRDGWDLLDVLYARGRMRKWLIRTMPRPEARGLVSSYTSPATVRVLLDVPLEHRRTGQVFQAACALREPALHAVACAALPPAALPAPSRVQRLARRGLPRQVRALARRARPRPLQGPLAQVLGQVPQDGVCREVLGSAWLDEAVRSGTRTRELWNVVAVEALALWLDRAGGD